VNSPAPANGIGHAIKEEAALLFSGQPASVVIMSVPHKRHKHAMLLGSQSVDLNQKSRGSLHDSGKTAGVVAQHLALAVDEMHARTSLAGDSLVIVLGRIFIVVQPVLDLHLSDRAGEEQCGHRRNILWHVASDGVKKKGRPRLKRLEVRKAEAALALMAEEQPKQNDHRNRHAQKPK
jgi:hypothetical protein